MPLGPVEVLVGGVEAVKAPVAVSGEQLPLNGIGCGGGHHHVERVAERPELPHRRAQRRSQRGVGVGGLEPTVRIVLPG